MKDSIVKSHYGNIENLFKDFNNLDKICEICGSNGKKVPIKKSHSLQKSLLSKLLEINGDITGKEVINFSLIGNSAFGLLVDLEKKPEQNVEKIINTIKFANVFYNLCFTCEKTEIYEEEAVKLNDVKLSEHDLKTIFLKGLLSKKFHIDREIYVRKRIKSIQKSPLESDKNMLNYIYPEISTKVKDLEDNSDYIRSIVNKVKTDKQKPRVLFEYDDDLKNFSLKFGSLTSRIASIDNIIAPFVIYICPYKNKTKILILGTDKTFNLVNDIRSPLYVKNYQNDWMLNVAKLISIDTLDGLVFSPNNINLGKIIDLSFKIKKMILLSNRNDNDINTLNRYCKSMIKLLKNN